MRPPDWMGGTELSGDSGDAFLAGSDQAREAGLELSDVDICICSTYETSISCIVLFSHSNIRLSESLVEASFLRLAAGFANVLSGRQNSIIRVCWAAFHGLPIH